jgi:hypothetical protein
MREKLQECRDVEELAYIHVQYTSALQYQCLLNEKVRPLRILTKLSTIHRTVMDILGLAVTFVEKYLQLKREVLSTRKERHVRRGSISDEEEESQIILETGITDAEFVDLVRYLDDRFLRALPFIRSGLKGTTRAAEFPSLGILASTLETGVR